MRDIGRPKQAGIYRDLVWLRALDQLFMKVADARPFGWINHRTSQDAPSLRRQPQSGFLP